MKYKALITDIDGTLIPNRKDGVISQRVTDAITRAKSLIHIGVATSRDLSDTIHLFKHLSLSGPSILYSGCWVVDTNTHKVLWQQNIERAAFDEAYAIAKKLGFYFVVNDDGKKYKPGEPYTPKFPINIWGHGLEQDQMNEFKKETSHIASLAVHTLPSWKEGKIDFVASHVLATKQHAILELAKILGIETNEIIGVGDGNNDLPLLMACGLKVAMGNAGEDLKAIADYVAPTVEEDGLADVIEKFVLQ